MSLGLLGKKLGMTHIFDEHGHHIACTAVELGPCTIVRKRTKEKDQYDALQVGYLPVSEKKQIRPIAGQFKSVNSKHFKHLKEFRLDEPVENEIGSELTLEIFEDFEVVDVVGTSIGKGFQGGMKRFGWSGGPKTHGSNSHRAPGSSGAGTTPGRVLRGHNAPGHMGNEQVTVQNLRIVRRLPEENLVLIEGAIPGAKNSMVIVRKSRKRPGQVRLSRLASSEELEAAAAKKAARGKKK